MIEFAPQIPLLVPSFSSKGNLFLHKGNGKFVSDNYSLMQELDIRVSKSYLISAYDVYYGLMPQNPEEWPETEYLFVDSGGYETNDSFDLSERNKFNYNVLPWDIEKMRSVYSRIVSCEKLQNSIIILSGFDSFIPFEEQLEKAISLSADFPSAVINFIVKMAFPINRLSLEIENAKRNLSDISIIGVTEKELGDSVQERALNLISIRKQLSSCNWVGNIHIYGGLEPNLVKLYYYAGADIFDGLSWQRIRYRGNSTLYDPASFNVSLAEHENKYLMMVDNLAVLQSISTDLSTSALKRFDNLDILEASLKSDDLSINNLLNLMEA